MITVKTKIIVFIIFMMICIVSFFIYRRYESQHISSISPLTPEQVKQKIGENAANVIENYKGTYLYLSDPKKDVLYLQTPDKVYKVGKFSDCPNIINQPNAYEITDIIQVYNCLSIPDEYKDKCDGKTGDIEIIMKTADDFQNYLEQQSSGNTYTPSVDICWQPTYDQQTQKDVTNFFTKKYYDIREYLQDHSQSIIDLAKQIGIMKAVDKTIGHFGMIVLVAQGFLSDKKWIRIKSGLMSGQIFLGAVMGSILEALPIIEKESTQIIEEAGGQTYEVAVRCAVEVLTRLNLSLGTRELLGSICANLSKVFGVVGYIQLAGMILDAFDPCAFNSMNKNLTQEMLDNIKETYDKSMFISTGGLSYPTIWDPSVNICDYDLDPQSCEQKYDMCLTDDEKSKIKKEDYCNKDWTTNFKKYQKEYLDHLKVNSLGQDITKLTNAKLAEYFSQYVGGGLDWSVISTVDKENYLKNFTLPNNETLRVFDLYAVNNNAVVASYINEYWYFFLSFFILVAVLLFVL